jgi:hypothetical protein
VMLRVGQDLERPESDIYLLGDHDWIDHPDGGAKAVADCPKVGCRGRVEYTVETLRELIAIDLPAGWTLRDGFNVRPGGCGVFVTEFTNQGGGLPTSPSCRSSTTPPVPGCGGSTYTPSSSRSRAPSAVRPSCSRMGHWAVAAPPLLKLTMEPLGTPEPDLLFGVS